jgi:DNA repair exonuclease SbcCD ATPase subunit
MPSTVWLKRLKVRAFRSLVDEQSIDLPKTGMVLVAGQNGDTDGSSGAGKTSLVESLAYALGYGEFSATDLQSWSWLTDESIQVKLELGHALFREVAIQRGKPTWFEADGVKHTSAKAVTEKVNEVLGLSPELLKALTYRPQKTPGLFLAMTDSEKKLFLTDLLGLGDFVGLLETCDSNIHLLEKDLFTAKAAYDARLGVVPPMPSPPKYHLLEGSLEAIEAFAKAADKAEEAVNALKARDLELSRLGVEAEKFVDDEYRLPYAEARNAVERLKETPPLPFQAAKMATNPPDFSDIDKKLSWLQEEMKKRLYSHQDKLEVLRAQVGGERLELDRVFQSEKELSRLLKELESLTKSLCPTCERPWEETKARMAALEPQVAELQAKVADRVLLTNRISAGEAELAKLKLVDPVPAKMPEAVKALENAKATATANWQAEVERARSAHKLVEAQWKTTVAEARSAADAIKLAWAQKTAKAKEMTPEQNRVRQELAAAQQALSDIRASRQETISSLNERKAENDRETFRYDQGVKAYDAAMVVANTMSSKVDQVESRLNVEMDFKAMLKGFLSLIFDETLGRISDLTNDRLSRIPNVAGVTLSFESERETLKGTFKQTIHPVVRKDGNVIPLKAGVSGGMYTAVELAVDLSLADVIAERTGSYPGWLILDEAFEGLDTVCKSACFDMLKEAARERLILVIDHTREFTEMFDQVVTIKYSNGKSAVG